MINNQNLLLFFTVLVSSASIGQNLSDKTNLLSFNFKNRGIPKVERLPKISWVSPQFDFTTNAQKSVEIEAIIESQHHPQLLRVVLLNGKDQSVRGSKDFNPGSSFPGIYKLKQSLFLPDGPSTIVIELTTAEGVVISDQRTILIGDNGNENMLAADRKDYALLFATDKYDHWDDLVNPIDDAHAIARELREKYSFETEIVENATMEQVWEKLRVYNERTFNPQDQLLIFFAGHGHYDESFGEGFVVAKNSLQKDLSRSTYISHNRLRGVVSNIPSKHIMLMMDVCFGGTLDPSIARSRGAAENEVAINEMIARKLGYRTRKYITSGGKEYVSDGIPGRHSPFAESVIEALRSRGGEDLVLTLAEMQTYLEKLKQQPRLGSFGDDESLSDFVFIGKR